MEASGILSGLKQRKIVQWAVAYAAGAWAFLQVIELVSARFAWPDAIARGLIIAVCIGFVVVLLLAWYHGERGQQTASGSELLLITLVLAVGGGWSGDTPARRRRRRR